MIERERGTEPERHEQLKDAHAVPLDEARPTSAATLAEDVEFERQMRIAREVMREHRAVLAALAK